MTDIRYRSIFFALRRPALLLLLGLLLHAPARAEPREAGDRPNVVILFCDDAGYGDFGFTGHPTILTPHLDRMRREGMAFTQLTSASPGCTASRYGLLTGRSPCRSGFGWVLYPKSPRGLHADELTIAELLKRRGYATAIFGKWHLGFPNEKNGHDPTRLPLAHGFDEWYGLPYSNDMQPPKWPDLPLLSGPVEETNCGIEGYRLEAENPDQSKLTAAYTERAVAFLERKRETPFFLYLPYAMPHVPLHPGEAFAGRSRRGTYGDVIEEIDASVGRILARLRSLRIAENTLVVFTSDNGPWITKGIRGGSAGPFRDGKGSTWEGGMRVPALFWWPGRIPAGSTCAVVASTLDLLPTTVALAGGTLPPDRALDGRSLAAELEQAPSTDAVSSFVYCGPGNRPQAIRVGPWKLHVKTNSQTGSDHGWPDVSRDEPLLFHLDQDPGECHCVAAAHPDVVKRLLAELEAFEAQVADEGSFWDAAD